jgi:hypothetical protein
MCNSGVCVCVIKYREGRSGFYGSIPGGGWECSLQNRVQNGSAAHPASYPTGTMGSFLGG